MTRSATEINEEYSALVRACAADGHALRELEERRRCFDPSTTTAAQLVQIDGEIALKRASIEVGERRVLALRDELKKADRIESLPLYPAEIRRLAAALATRGEAVRALRAAEEDLRSAVGRLNSIFGAATPMERSYLPEVPSDVAAAVHALPLNLRLPTPPLRDDGRRAIVEAGKPGVTFLGPWTDRQKEDFHRFHRGTHAPAGAVTRFMSGPIPGGAR